MVGQAAKAADMRSGDVPKPGMKAMNGGGGSVSRSSQKFKPAPVEKPKAKAKGQTHGQLVMQWEQNGRDANGKLIKFVEKKQGWSKEEVNKARDRALEEQRRAAEVTLTPAADVGEEVEVMPMGEQAHLLARTRMAELARALQQLTVTDSGGVGSGGSCSGGGSEGDARSAEELWAAAEFRRRQLEEVRPHRRPRTCPVFGLPRI